MKRSILQKGTSKYTLKYFIRPALVIIHYFFVVYCRKNKLECLPFARCLRSVLFWGKMQKSLIVQARMSVGGILWIYDRVQFIAGPTHDIIIKYNMKKVEKRWLVLKRIFEKTRFLK